MSSPEALMAIVGSGTAMGIVHALTGPDHMSALVTVAVNERCKAFWLGARWGIGHSTGLVLVTVAMLLLRDSFGMDEGVLLEDVKVVMNWFVGVAMLGLGLWSYYRANKLRNAYLAQQPGRVVLLPGRRRCSVGAEDTSSDPAEVSTCNASAIELVESPRAATPPPSPPAEVAEESLPKHRHGHEQGNESGNRDRNGKVARVAGATFHLSVEAVSGFSHTGLPAVGSVMSTTLTPKWLRKPLKDALVAPLLDALNDARPTRSSKLRQEHVRGVFVGGGDDKGQLLRLDAPAASLVSDDGAIVALRIDIGEAVGGGDQAQHEHGHEHGRGAIRAYEKYCSCCPQGNRAKTALALGIGILHGIGGPGGVLAVLPTLAIPGVVGALLYLGSFCTSSTLTMGAFAAFYGECTHRSTRLSERLPYVLAFVSGSTSVLVGTAWLIASATIGVDGFLEALGIED